MRDLWCSGGVPAGRSEQAQREQQLTGQPERLLIHVRRDW